MKRGKIFSILTSSAMVLSLSTPLNVFAQDSNTITLDATRKESLTVQSGEVTTLDLNGQTMTGAIVNNGTLTIKDSTGKGKVEVTGNHVIINNGTLTVEGGEYDALSHGKGALVNNQGATATVENGTFLRSNEKGTYDPNKSNGNSWYTINNIGTLTINNAKVENNGGFSSAIENGWSDGSKNTAKKDAKLTINGGTYEGGINTVKNDDYGNLTITNGTFSNTTQHALMNYNVAKISGGKFVSTSNTIINTQYDDVMDKGELTITGGHFTSGNGQAIFTTQKDSNPAFGVMDVTGGTYSTNNLGVDLINENYHLFKDSSTNEYKLLMGAYTFSAISELSLKKGEIASLDAQLNPLDAPNKISYSSKDSSIASVDEKGNVTGHKNGKTVIYVHVEYFDEPLECAVRVYEISDVKAPTLDTTKPVEEVKAGITDKKLNGTVQDTLDFVINGVINGSTNVTNVSEETKASIIKAVEAGETIKVEPVVETKDAKDVTTKEKNLITKIISEDTDGTVTVAQYLDLQFVLKTESGNKLGNLNELNDSVEFTVALPKNLLKDGRRFHVVRVHDGVAEKLYTTLNKDGTLTFMTNKFSTYAVVYEDAKEEKEPEQNPETGDKGNTGTKEDAKNPENTNTGSKAEIKGMTATAKVSTKTEAKKVKTGDESNTAFYVVLGLMAVAGCTILFLFNKKSQLLNK